MVFLYGRFWYSYFFQRLRDKKLSVVYSFDCDGNVKAEDMRLNMMFVPSLVTSVPFLCHKFAPFIYSEILWHKKMIYGLICATKGAIK